MSTVKTDLSSRLAALMHLSQSVNATMFSPGTPPRPLWEDEPPRLFEYRPGINLVTIPRAGYGVLPFPVLRALAQASKEIRLNIELIKRTIRGLEWSIEAKNVVHVGDQHYQANADDVVTFMEKPDGVNDFDSWVNMLLEDLLVIDAVTIYPDVDELGCLRSLDLIDGATIRPLLDLRGRIPRPPDPAYVQVLYGMPMTHYSADQLIYVPLNKKVHTPYGESPIEWALMAINTAIRHDAVRLGWFTEGNIPGVLVSVSPDWTAEQLQMFTEYFEALAKGDIHRASKILFVPGNGTQSIFQPNQGDVDKIEVDKWLMQVVCWAFGNNPAEFGLVPASGLGGAGYVQGMENAHYRSMIGPITGYLKALFDRIIQKYFSPAFEFKWIGLEPPEDELRRAQVDQIYLSMGVFSPAYVQDRLGVPVEYRDGSRATVQQDISPFLPFIQRAIKAELNDWRERTRREFKRGDRFSVFYSKVIPEDMYSKIVKSLQDVRSVEDLDRIFDEARNALQDTQYLEKAVLSLSCPAQEVGEAQPFRYP